MNTSTSDKLFKTQIKTKCCNLFELLIISLNKILIMKLDFSKTKNIYLTVHIRGRSFSIFFFCFWCVAEECLLFQIHHWSQNPALDVDKTNSRIHLGVVDENCEQKKKIMYQC